MTTPGLETRAANRLAPLMAAIGSMSRRDSVGGFLGGTEQSRTRAESRQKGASSRAPSPRGVLGHGAGVHRPLWQEAKARARAFPRQGSISTAQGTRRPRGQSGTTPVGHPHAPVQPICRNPATRAAVDIQPRSSCVWGMEMAAQTQ